tara:strand:+ start:10455 stop:10631 length:177 start_codon:yes stop_codon:yes gene_type:complete
MELGFCIDEEAIKSHIKSCEGKHIQQIAYSSYHDALTQVCFTCNCVRTTLKEEEVRER